MTQDYKHPVVPLAQQLGEWETEFFDEGENLDVLLIRAFQAGADQELAACCEWLEKQHEKLGWAYRMHDRDLRTARR